MDPFAKHTPSVFVVCSPFQVLCAVEALNEFEIEDYLVIAVFYEGDSRNNQLKKCLDFFKLRYKIIYSHYSKWKHRFTVFKSFFPRWCKFKRGFVGDSRFADLLLCCTRYLSNNSDVIYLDDGAASIIEFNSFGRQWKTPVDKRVSQICKFRSIRYGNFYFSKFDNYSRNDLFVVKNHMNFFKNYKKDKSKTEGITFIGTNPEMYIKNYADINLELFFCKFESLLKSIREKYPNEKVSFFAHPRDTNEMTRKICKNFDVIYTKADIAAEIDLLLSPTMPKCLYGFNSTVLCNMKEYFPQMNIVSCVLSHNCNNDMDLFNNYIEKMGIRIIYDWC